MKMQAVRNSAGWVIVTTLSLSPVLLWAPIKPLETRFANLATTLTSIGQLAGLVGMTMFALTLVLSTRHRILERFFDGMNRAYAAHHRFGAIAFSLLLLHPILLAFKYAIIASTHDAALFLISTNPEILTGTMALLSMMLFLVLTFFVSFAYDKWKITHKFLAVSFILASVHTLIVYSDTQVSTALYWYMAAYVGIGLIAILCRTIAPKLFISTTEYIIDEIRHLDEKTIEIFMKPAFKPIGYTAGQFIFVSLENDAIGKEAHPFSIASAPGEPRLAIAVKTLGDYTGKLKIATKNTVAKIEGPFGSFSYMRGVHKDQVWIAGGIGITPFLSMAKSITDPEYSIDIYYCVRDKAEAVFLEDLQTVAITHPNIRLIAFCSNEQGHITADSMQAQGIDLTTKDFFICGPTVMMHELRKQLLHKGVDSSCIHTEEFTFR